MASVTQEGDAFTKSFIEDTIDKQDFVDPGDCQTQSENNEAPEDQTRGEEIRRVAGRKEEESVEDDEGKEENMDEEKGEERVEDDEGNEESMDEERGEEGVEDDEGKEENMGEERGEERVDDDEGKEENMDEERGEDGADDDVEGDEGNDVTEEKMEKEREEENVEEGEDESDGEIEEEQEDDVKQETQLRSNASMNAEGETEEAAYGESEEERVAEMETGNPFQNTQEEEEAVKSSESIYDGKLPVDGLNDKIRTLDMDLSGSLARMNRGSRSSSRKTTPIKKKYSMSSSRSHGLRGSFSTKGEKILERGSRSGKTSSGKTSSGKTTGGIITPARITDGSNRSITISRNPSQSDRNLHPTKRDSTLSPEDAPFESLSVVRPHNSEQRLWFSESEAIYVSPIEPSHASSGYGSAQGESYISPLIVDELSGGIPDPRYDLRGGLQQAHVEHMPKRQSVVASQKGKELNSNHKADGPEAIPIPNGYLLQHLQTTGRALAIPLPVPLLGVYGRPNPPPLKILEEKPVVKKAVVVTKVKSKIKPDAGAKTGKPNGGEARAKDTLRHSETEKTIPTQELAENHPKKTVKDHTPESLPSPPLENPIALPPLKNVQRRGSKLRPQGQATRKSVSYSQRANPAIKSSQIPPNQQMPPNPRQYPIQTGELFYAPQQGGHQKISPVPLYPPARWGCPPDNGQEYYGQSRPPGRNPHELYQQPPNFSSEYNDGNQPRYNTQPPYPTNNNAPPQFYESNIPTLPNISPNGPVPKLGKTSKIQKEKTKTTSKGPTPNNNLSRADTIAIGNEGRLLKVNTMSRKGEHASIDRKRQQPPAVNKVAANKNKEYARNEEERRQRDEEAFAWEQYVLQQQQRIADPSMMWGCENAYNPQQPNVHQQTYPPNNHKQANHAPKQKQGTRRT